MTGKAVLSFLEKIGVMKTMYRAGWGMCGIKTPESIADHCFRVSMFSMIVADVLSNAGKDIDTEKIIKISLLHEVAESQIGDIPYPALKYIPEDIKSKAEEKAVESMFEDFGELKGYYLGLWKEFECRTSLEGHIVQVCDKMECMMQVNEYEKLGYRGFDEFWTTEWNKKGFYDYSITSDIFQILKERHSQRKTA